METVNDPNRDSFLNPREFTQRSLGRLGLKSVEELKPIDKLDIITAFHVDRSDRDEIVWLDNLELNDQQKRLVWQLLCARGSELCTLARILLQDKNDKNEVEIEHLL